MCFKPSSCHCAVSISYSSMFSAQANTTEKFTELWACLDISDHIQAKMQNLTYWYKITQLSEVYDVSITADISII